jgi:hypothetical protein
MTIIKERLKKLLLGSSTSLYACSLGNLKQADLIYLEI